MSFNYKRQLGFLFIFFLMSTSGGNLFAASNMGPDSVRVIPEQGVVRKLTGNRLLRVTDQGLNLEDGDEVITSENAKANVLLSMLSEFDEILLGPSSRIRISIKVSDSYTSIYRIHLLYGKIRAYTMLNHSKQVEFTTSQAEVTTDEGEFILQSSKKGTTIGAISGIVKLVSRRSNQEYQIPENVNMFVSHFDTVSPTKMFSHQLYKGVEKHESEILPDPVKLQQDRKRQEQIRRDKQALSDQREAEKEPVQQINGIQKPKEVGKTQIETPLIIQKPQSEAISEAHPPEVEEVQIVPAIVEAEDEESFLSKYGWHITASSTFLSFNYLALQEANSYNELASENDDLQTRYSNSTSTSERASLLTDYEVNKEKMSKHKSYMQLYNIFALGAMAWEGYLLYDLFFGDADESKGEKPLNDGLSLYQNETVNLNYIPQTTGIRFSFNWYW
jgi:hypothetical protein